MRHRRHERYLRARHRADDHLQALLPQQLPRGVREELSRVALVIHHDEADRATAHAPRSVHEIARRRRRGEELLAVLPSLAAEIEEDADRDRRRAGVDDGGDDGHRDLRRRRGIGRVIACTLHGPDHADAPEDGRGREQHEAAARSRLWRGPGVGALGEAGLRRERTRLFDREDGERRGRGRRHVRVRRTVAPRSFAAGLGDGFDDRLRGRRFDPERTRELRRHRRAVREARFGITRDGAREPLVDRGRQRRSPLRQRGGGHVVDGEAERIHRRARKRCASRQRAEGDERERIEVALAVEIGAPRRLLRAHVRGRADGDAGRGDGRRLESQRRDAEIEDLREERRASFDA